MDLKKKKEKKRMWKLSTRRGWRRENEVNKAISKSLDRYTRARGNNSVWFMYKPHEVWSQ